MKPWEDGEARVADEEIDAKAGPTPVQFNQSRAGVVDGPVRFRRLESNDLLADEVVQADMVAAFIAPFTNIRDMTDAAHAALVGEATSFITSAQGLADTDAKQRHLDFGMERLSLVAAALAGLEGRIGVVAIRRQFRTK